MPLNPRLRPLPAAPTASWAAPRWVPRRGRRAPAREEEKSSGTQPCSAPRVPPPWSWLSSRSVERCGASLLPAPWRRSSVHTSSKHGGDALFAALRLPGRGQHQPWRRPLTPFSQKCDTKQGKRNYLTCGCCCFGNGLKRGNVDVLIGMGSPRQQRTLRHRGLRKTGAQLRDNPEEREKSAKTAKSSLRQPSA